ncbi:MAG: hypothetical protein JW726_15110 [Anaerolineales bacterium]|nr:hypothetical protein [Anaerolineales bacterium]
MQSLKDNVKAILRQPTIFTTQGRIWLRSYQEQVALAIIDSVLNAKGLSFVVMFPRQSGKNELQAQIEAYLLTILSEHDLEMVKVSPTWKPQSLNAMRRLQRTLENNLITQGRWKKESGYIYRLGKARIAFLSGDPAAHIVGHTASALLECDEAQDVTIAKWDKEIAPMAASTNATRVFWGTAWTSQTLLARELRAAQVQEQATGLQLTWKLTADLVGQEVQPYKEFIAQQIARLGRNHPMVRTQFFSEEIDAEGGMFGEKRIALMQGAHAPCTIPPRSGGLFAFCIDVAGEDESATLEADRLTNPGRDSTALTIFEVDLSGLSDPGLGKPIYRTLHRELWTGIKHTALYATLRGLIEAWQPRYVVIDSTGVGAGLASFLSLAFPRQVLPFVFSSKTKSQLGWDFLAVIESGRFKEYAADLDQNQTAFWEQLTWCQYEIVEGPGKVMRWGVPAESRSPQTGDLIHDDLVLSAALVALLDSQPFGLGTSQVVTGVDPLAGLGKVF